MLEMRNQSLLSPWVPADRMAGVERALGSFRRPLQYVEAFRRPTAGALSLKIAVDGRVCVLELLEAGLDAGLWERGIQGAVQAAEWGVAPAVHYASGKDGVLICALVEPPKQVALPALGRALWTVHHGTPLAADASVNDSLQRDVAAYVDAAPGACIVAAIKQISQAGSRLLQPPSAPCHNGLHLEGVVLGAVQVFLRGWHASGLGDPAGDLATVCAFMGSSKGQTDDFLAAYAEGALNAADRARVIALQPVMLLRAALGSLLTCHPVAPVGSDRHLLDDAPSLAAWRRDVTAGRYGLRSATDLRRHGLVLIKAALAL